MQWLPHDDDDHLLRALELARGAAAFASPNPSVGCVLTTPGGDVLGEGAHFYDHRDHAEIAALKDAAAKGNSVRGATAFVTLEPCSVQGRTGPCAAALVAAGIARCVVATVDPNPAVCGRGLAKLRDAGVEVVLASPGSLLARDARRLNDAFAFSIVQGRPFVTLKAAVSVDGKLAPPEGTRVETAPVWLTGEAARADVQRLRHASDAIVTGIGTVLADDPALTDRTELPRRRPLLRVVLDGGLRLPLGSKLVRSAAGDVVVFCGAEAEARKEAALVAAGVEVVRLRELGEVMRVLQERGMRSVLLEAGPGLNGEFLRQGLVDRVVLYFAEVELGAGAVPFAEGGVSAIALQQGLSGVERVGFAHGGGEDVRISGYVRDPWVGV